MQVKINRLYWLDFLRFALLFSMILYHFYWDLSYFNLINNSPFSKKLWQYFAHATAAGFLLISGFSLTLSYFLGDNANFKTRFIIRLSKLVISALAITIITYVVFPQNYIYFGILHQIAIASLILLILFRLSIILNIICVFILLLFNKQFITMPAFSWVGLSNFVKPSLDFVPIFPWTAYIIIGSILARLYLKVNIIFYTKKNKFITFCSKNSLIIYLIHQPILFSIVYLINILLQQNIITQHKHEFINACIQQCHLSKYSNKYCTKYCSCVMSKLYSQKLEQSIKSCIN